MKSIINLVGFEAVAEILGKPRRISLDHGGLYIEEVGLAEATEILDRISTGHLDKTELPKKVPCQLACDCKTKIKKPVGRKKDKRESGLLADDSRQPTLLGVPIDAKPGSAAHPRRIEINEEEDGDEENHLVSKMRSNLQPPPELRDKREEDPWGLTPTDPDSPDTHCDVELTEELKSIESLRGVVDFLVRKRNGMSDQDIVATCLKLRNDIPCLRKISNLQERAMRQLTTLKD